MEENKTKRHAIVNSRNNETNVTPNKNQQVNDIFTKEVMRYLSRYIGHEWELLGFNLGLNRSDVAQAAADNKNNHKNKVYQMLLMWLKNNENNRQRYSACVRALETSGRKDLAQKIHCAKWSEQSFDKFEMPSNFPMMIRIDKVRPKRRNLRFSNVRVNDLNPSTGPPVHAHSAKFIAAG